MNDRPSDVSCDEPSPDAVASFEQYKRARNGYRNVIDFRAHQMARQQTNLDLANALARAFRSADAGKYDDDPEGAA